MAKPISEESRTRFISEHYYEAFKQSYLKLKDALPINDLLPYFLKEGIVPEYLKIRLDSIPVSSGKVVCLLNKIERGLRAGIIDQFISFICVMEEFATDNNNVVVKMLSDDIRSIIEPAVKQSQSFYYEIPRNLWTQHDSQDEVLSTPLLENIKDKVLKSIMVLLVCANVNETSATLSYLHPLDDHKAIFRFDQDGKQVYYIGKYGVCPAAVTNVPPEVDISTLANQCFPYLCATVSVGVACGIKEKVQMCDILVSSQIVNYDEVVDLDQIHSPKEKSPWLIKMFSQPKHWPNNTVKEHLPNKGMPMPKVMSGVILSGPLYHGDDPTVNNSFEKCGGKAIGIEMQRAYYFTKHTLNVIIVKAVCNFKDGKDNEVYQPTAALLAADLVHVCLSDHQGFEELEEAVKRLVQCAVVFDQIQNKDEMPSMRDLYRYVVHKYASEWEDIAIELGLDEEIAIIEKDNRGSIDCLKKTLRKWLDSTPHATWKMLEVTITNVKRVKMRLDPITDVYASEERDLKQRT